MADPTASAAPAAQPTTVWLLPPPHAGPRWPRAALAVAAVAIAGICVHLGRMLEATASARVTGEVSRYSDARITDIDEDGFAIIGDLRVSTLFVDGTVLTDHHPDTIGVLQWGDGDDTDQAVEWLHAVRDADASLTVTVDVDADGTIIADITADGHGHIRVTGTDIR